MKSSQQINLQKSIQHGIMLIEALIALLILALGVLGLAAVQARMLVEMRTTNSRATAIRLIADLGDRIRLNAVGAQPGVIPGYPNSPYADTGSNIFNTAAQAQTVFADLPFPVAPCNPDRTINITNTCSPQSQAVFDAGDWRSEVANLLMNGVASITQVSPQQLRVIVAWQLNENTHTTLAGHVSAAAQQLASQLQITGADQTASLCVDSTHICHVDFIEIPSPN